MVRNSSWPGNRSRTVRPATASASIASVGRKRSCQASTPTTTARSTTQSGSRSAARTSHDVRPVLIQ
ncbi:hypothetical protein ACFQX6_27350 [Streptosporangium lutulentum]